MKQFRLATVGDNCVDRFQSPLDQSLIGGNAVNVAVQLAQLGHEVSYFGAVGEDADGARIIDLLRANGVLTGFTERRPGVTAYTNIDVRPDGERVLAFEDFGVCDGYAPSPADAGVLKAMDHVHIGWLNDGGCLKRALLAAGVSVSQDLSVNGDLASRSADGLTIAFGSAGEDRAIAEDMMRAFLCAGAALAVVTRGAMGSCAMSRTEEARTGINRVPLVDTTGAGDSFIAGFLSARLSGLPLQTCLETGRDRASLTCGHVGGFPQTPLPL